MSKHILVIDDEVDMLFLLRTIIEDNTNYQVETTNNPLEGIELIKKSDFDLVLTDLKMPVMDGMDLFSEVKQLNPNLPVIIITAYGSQGTANAALEEGVTDFITKPFRKDSILFTIKRTLELAQVKRENIDLKRRLNEKE